MRRTRWFRRGLLVGMLLPALGLAQVYRWTDEKGRVHYGDKPPAGAASRSVQNRISSITGPALVSRAPAVKSGAPGVTLYSTAWCGYCKKARQHFAQRGVSFKNEGL